MAWLNKTFLKFLSRFILLILLGLISVVIAGYFNETEQHKAAPAGIED